MIEEETNGYLLIGDLFYFFEYFPSQKYSFHLTRLKVLLPKNKKKGIAT